MRKSKQDWVNLIQEFEGSDLNQTEFCKAQGLNPKYFSLKRSRLLQPNKTSGFVKVSPQSITTMRATLECGQVRIHFGQDTPLQIIANLARELA